MKKLRQSGRVTCPKSYNRYRVDSGFKFRSECFYKAFQKPLPNKVSILSDQLP